jgi:hypothetical protein
MNANIKAGTAMQAPRPEIDRAVDFGIRGMLQVFMRHTYASAPSYTTLGALTDSELATIRNQARNIQSATTAGLRTLGGLVSSYNEDTGGFDFNCVGWMIQHLTDTLEAASEVEFSADAELLQRGYDQHERPLSAYAKHAKDQLAA